MFNSEITAFPLTFYASAPHLSVELGALYFHLVCVRSSVTMMMFAQYLWHVSMDFNQTSLHGASCDKDELIMCQGQGVTMRGIQYKA